MISNEIARIDLSKNSFSSQSPKHICLVDPKLNLRPGSDQETPSVSLRDYQKRIVGDTYQLIRDGHKRILIVAVMGAGKTVISSWIMRDAVSRQRKCVFLVMFNVLLEQTQKTLQRLGVHCTVMQGARNVDHSAPVVIASLQTISARLRRGVTLDEMLGDVDLFIVDEAHLAAYHSSYEEIESHYLKEESNTRFLGLTATPWRLGRKQWLGQKFDKLVLGPQPPEIIKMGGAVPCRGFTLTGAIDLDTLHIRDGDFIDSEIAAQATRQEALDYIFNEWVRLACDRPTLMIGATVNQSKMTRDRFLSSGISTELIIGETPHEERQAIFERVRSGKTQIITSVGALTAGFDLPQISAILYVRATKSKALFSQSAGRGSRPCLGKTDYILLDFGGNLKRFGNPMGFQTYDISEPKPIPESISTKDCPQCGHECWSFTMVCPECGFEFSLPEQMTSNDDFIHPGELNEFFDAQTKKQLKKLRALKKQSFNEWKPPQTADSEFWKEFGFNAPNDWHLYACLGKRPSKKKKDSFVEWVHFFKGKGGDSWVKHQLMLEFGDAQQAFKIPAAWYEVLGVPISASWLEVKAAYREKAKEFHPDVCSDPDAEDRMKEINEAFCQAKLLLRNR